MLGLGLKTPDFETGSVKTGRIIIIYLTSPYFKRLKKRWVLKTEKYRGTQIEIK